MIISFSHQAMELIDETLKMAREREFSGRVGRVDASSLVVRILEERAEILRERGVRVEVDGDLGTMHAGRAHLYQLFSNLMDNAMRFAPEGKGVVEVRRLGEEGGAFRYLVRDNGPGLETLKPERLFRPFWKGKDGRTGVGLAAVSRLVEIYVGEIRAYNDGGPASSSPCVPFPERRIPAPGRSFPYCSVLLSGRRTSSASWFFLLVFPLSPGRRRPSTSPAPDMLLNVGSAFSDT